MLTRQPHDSHNTRTNKPDILTIIHNTFLNITKTIMDTKKYERKTQLNPKEIFQNVVFFLKRNFVSKSSLAILNTKNLNKLRPRQFTFGYNKLKINRSILKLTITKIYLCWIQRWVDCHIDIFYPMHRWRKCYKHHIIGRILGRVYNFTQSKL